MKEDAPPPKRPPKKRRALERAPDYWLAVWAADEDLSPGERELTQLVRDARKAARPDAVVGILVDRENITPVQANTVKEQLLRLRPTEIHHPWTTSRVVGLCRSVGVPITTHSELREVVMASKMIIGAPRGQQDLGNLSPAWDSIRYAKHRSLPVTVVLPSGELC